ncbi:hypothetical protein [Streptomyces peucetius]|uniref:Uncharacterized protein n=1 Tax=Streptomyces peucetius TaxID=1950 RepID=A0ABY6IIG2_STRPE|nr:hypothetical protein [Streptomyces peucetius]UYQ66800.1 hypothetical protein OGH68_00240 [Streptomyces peucetius]
MRQGPWPGLRPSLLQHAELDRKSAILAHQGEVARERPLPGILARLPEPERNEIISTESFTRLTPGPIAGDPYRLLT